MHGGRRWVSSSPEEGYPGRWSALAVLSLVLFVLGIDHTILNTALPRLALALQPTAGELLWIVDAYVVVFAGLLMVGGTLGDRLGRKHVMLLGLILFAGGSAVGTWAGSPLQLIVGRAVMGLGGALVMPATLSTVTNMFPAAERTKAITIWAAVPVLGLVAGPVLSGALLEHFWWGSVLLINLPLILAVFVGTLLFVPDTRNEKKPRVDLVGAVLSFAGLTLLLYAIIEATARGWTNVRVLATGTVALALFGVFVLWERRTREPMLDLALLRDPRFTASSGSLTLTFFALAGMMFGLSQYLQFVLGFTPLQAGIRLLPVAVASTLASLASPRLVKPLGRRVTVSGGLALTALGLGVMSLVGQIGGYGIVAVAQFLLGAGVGLAMAPATDSIMEAVPREKAGVGSAVNDTVRELGGALGVAVLGSVLASVYSSAMSNAVRGLPATAADTLPAAAEVARALPDDAGSALMSAAGAAFAGGMSITLLLGAGIAMIGAVLALIFVPAKQSASRGARPRHHRQLAKQPRREAHASGKTA